MNMMEKHNFIVCFQVQICVEKELFHRFYTQHYQSYSTEALSILD